MGSGESGNETDGVIVTDGLSVITGVGTSVMDKGRAVGDGRVKGAGDGLGVSVIAGYAFGVTVKNKSGVIEGRGELVLGVGGI